MPIMAPNAIKRLLILYDLGAKKLSYLSESAYFEGTIDPTAGNDWNQSAPVDTTPTLDDFKKTVSDYLAWEVSNILKCKPQQEDERLGK